MSQSGTKLRNFIKTVESFGRLDDKLLDNFVACAELVVLNDGDCLFRQGEMGNALYIITAGTVRVAINQAAGGEVTVATRQAGSLIGEMQLLLGGVRSASVYAQGEVSLVKISQEAFTQLVTQAPEAADHVTLLIRHRLWQEQLRTLLPGLFGPLDDAALREIELQINWVEVPRGEYLFRQEDASDDLYIVVSGYLEVLMAPNPRAPAQVVDHVSHGEYIGEITILTGEPRRAGVCAVRDSVLAKFPGAVFADFCQRYPRVMQSMAKVAFSRLQRQRPGVGRAQSSIKAKGNLAVISLHPSAADFAHRLSSAMTASTAVLHVNSAHAERLFPALSELRDDDPRQIRLSTWLDQQELQQQLLIYEADMSASNWTKRCVQRADHLLFVASAHSEPIPGALEEASRAWEHPSRPPLKSLILLHPDGMHAPAMTKKWLQGRAVDNVYHVRTTRQADIARLARIISGQAIGLAMGGGGARGMAHIGVIRALEEAGVPIDIVGGTSVGSVVAALYAMGLGWEAMMEEFRKFARMKPHRDYTFPLTGLVRGRKFDRVMDGMFQGTSLEDLWLTCFGISTNLTSAQMVVHDRGLVSKMVRASCSMPAIAVPAVENGNLYVDGGVLNNLPGDVMRERCGIVIAVDVSPHIAFTLDSQCEHVPSPWQVLRSRFNPFGKPLSVPNIVDVIERSIELGSFERKARVAADADLFLAPPVGHFRSIDVSSFNEIMQTGYAYSRNQIKLWQEKVI